MQNTCSYSQHHGCEVKLLLLSYSWLKSVLISIKIIVSTLSILFEDTLKNLKFTKWNIIKAEVCDINENENLCGIFYKLTYPSVFDTADNISLFGHILKFCLPGELTLWLRTLAAHRGPGFNFQYPHGCSQLLSIQVPLYAVFLQRIRIVLYIFLSVCP